MVYLLLVVLLVSAHTHQVLGEDRVGGLPESLTFLEKNGKVVDPFIRDIILAQIGRAPLQKPDGVSSAADPLLPWSLYLPLFTDPSSPCGVALTYMIDSLVTNSSIWALKMVDSWGKSRDGYLYGYPMIMATGVYDECVHTRSPDARVKGKYCDVVITSTGERMSEVEGHPRLVGVSTGISGPLPLFGTCIPDTCTAEDMVESLKAAFEGKTMSVHCSSLDEKPQFNAGDIAMITFLILMLVLLMIGTGADMYCTYLNTSASTSGVRFLLPFSIYTNLKKMFAVSTETRPGVISCLNGMRVLSMTWVIFGHQYAFDMVFSANFLHLGKRTNGLSFQIIMNATVSTDSFFFLSGLLAAYGVLREVTRTRKFNVIMYYLHRVIRLTPPIAVVSLLLATLFRFLPRGPFSSGIESTHQFCVKNWWMDVLYVNNFLAYDEATGQVTDCLGQCWYTAADTQMYLVAPLILIPLAFWPSRGEILLFLTTLASVIIPAAVIYANDYPPAGIMTLDQNIDVMGYTRNVYYTPWCRASAYIVGIWVGYIIFKYRSKKLILTPLQVMFGWTVAVFLALSVLLGMWSYNQITFDTFPYDLVTQVLYGGLHRAVWCASLAWVVISCHFGYGGPVNDFLSHPSWQPLARLTYAMFLVAIPVQLFMTTNLKEVYFITHLVKIIQTCGAFFISLVAAVLLSLTAEAPILGLEKLVFNRPGLSEDKPQATTASPAESHTNPAFSENKEVERKSDLEMNHKYDVGVDNNPDEGLNHKSDEFINNNPDEGLNHKSDELLNNYPDEGLNHKSDEGLNSVEVRSSVDNATL